MNEPTPIWHLQAQYNINGLIEALAVDDMHIRRRAMVALRKLRALDAIPAIKSAMLNEKDPETHTLMVETLKSFGVSIEEIMQPDQVNHADDTNLEQLVKQLESDDNDQVTEAARQLGEMGDKLAVSALVLLFNDARRSIQVRLAVAEALLKLESAPVEVALLANLRHTDWHIRRNGAAILGQLKAEWAIQPLARAISDPHQTVRRTARAALKHIGTPEARKALAQESNNAARQPIKPSTSPLSDTEALRRIEQAEAAASGEPPEAPRKGLLQRVDRDESDTETDAPQSINSDSTVMMRRSVGNTKPLSNIDPDAFRPRKKDESKSETSSSDKAE